MIPKTFVVPIDGSEFAKHAVDVAAGMARHCGANLKLVASSWNTYDFRSPVPELEATASKYADVVMETIVSDEKPAPWVIADAAKEPGHVVCMTTHGRGRMAWAALGSVAEQVIRDVPAPILLVGRHCATAWPTGARRLVLTVDGASAEPPGLQETIEWARAFNLDVEVATVIHPLDTEGPDREIDAIVKNLESAGLRARPCITLGTYVAGQLADAVVAAEADLVVMGSHARAGVARFALGSVTMGVVGLAPCPVLVTRAP
jgi:nucleotide-binding universal stress UspA family protein